MRRLPPEGDRGPQPLQSSLDAVTRGLGMRDSQGVGRLFASWESLVGPAIAAHVRPVRLDAEVLVVTVDHPAWATEVRQLGDDLLDRLATEVGVTRPGRLEIRIRR